MEVNDVETRRALHVRDVAKLIDRRSADGEKIPFSICVQAQNGRLIDTKTKKDCICLKNVPDAHAHLIKFMESEEVRQIRDVLILRVDDTRIIVG